MTRRGGTCAAALAVCAAAVGLLAIIGFTVGGGDGATDAGSSVVLFSAVVGAYFATRDDPRSCCWLSRWRTGRARRRAAASDDRTIYRSAP